MHIQLIALALAAACVSVGSGGPLDGLAPDDASQIAAKLPGVVIGPATEVPAITKVGAWYPLKEAT